MSPSTVDSTARSDEASDMANLRDFKRRETVRGGTRTKHPAVEAESHALYGRQVADFNGLSRIQSPVSGTGGSLGSRPGAPLAAEAKSSWGRLLACRCPKQNRS